MKVHCGDRIGRQGQLFMACSAAIYDAQHRLLLTRRSDNLRWCLPGGHMEPGESVSETCIREVWEETGLRIVVKRLIGVYSSPNFLLEYPNRGSFQPVILNFEGEVIGGLLQTTSEVAEVGYFTHSEIVAMDVLEHHRSRIHDAFSSESGPFIR